MPEKLHKPLPLGTDAASKAAHYTTVLEDLRAALADEDDWVAAMATTTAVLHGAFSYFSWTGFYRATEAVEAGEQMPGEQGDCVELVVGPYQGALGCTRIPIRRGVCGAAAATRRTQLVPDVDAFPGHIACSSR